MGEVRAAAALVWLGTVPGIAACVAGIAVLRADPGFLFVVLPFVACGLLGAGIMLVVWSCALALDLHARRQRARLRTALLGGGCLVLGLGGLPVLLRTGLVLALYGGALLWLMTRPAVADELGPWVIRPTAPWGSTPGRGIWAPLPEPGAPQTAWTPQAPQQGPWSPDPTTLPWLSWKGHSGPRPPWWVTWQAGLARGIPLWELLLLVASLLGALATVVLVLSAGMAWVVLMPLPLLGVVLVESRMRQRLSQG